MKNQTNTLKTWTTPKLKTLSISRDTKQTGPKDPPDFDNQAS
ncbi:hypothetical protein [Rhodohalobacter sulfatireducens]|nr:hypothetical protein [Rhodohalobacter sulfatireducens]MDR9364956.1 hypothetical protein [Balneolaceae bacterium]MDR9410148.1 hypothetical protein [Balneolaceae bacterium]